MEIKTLISEEEIQTRIKELAKQIDSDYNNEEIVIVCILKGAVFFAIDLAKRINLPVIIDFMKVSSYEGTESTKEIKFKLDISTDIKNKNVIIVEDIIDTGRTLTFLKNYLNEKQPKSLKICTLLDKKERREFELTPDYVCFDILDKFVIGYGLDYDEKYRDLPYIGYIE
jgi:hypoxanthine phosphoribosyltransferase